VAGLRRQRRGRAPARPEAAGVPPSFTLFLPLFPSPKLRGPERCHPWRHGEEGGGAAAGSLAGERVPHEGERAAVEGMRDGALWPNPHGGEGPMSTRLTSVCVVRAQGGAGGSGDGEVGGPLVGPLPDVLCTF
jgi:hypothetical protein